MKMGRPHKISPWISDQSIDLSMIFLHGMPWRPGGAGGYFQACRGQPRQDSGIECLIIVT